MRNQLIDHSAKTTTKAPGWRPFLRHGFEMVVSMTVGMMLLDPIWAALGAPTRPDVAGLITATDMTLAMVVWMLYRGHGRAGIVEMSAAMYVPFLVLLPPYWLGLLPGELVMTGGHILMLPAMAVAMLLRRAEYSHHHEATEVHPLIGVLGHRWPTWIALAITVDSWFNPVVPGPWTMLVLPVAYLVIGGLRGRLRDPRALALQVAGLVLYLGLIAAALNSSPTTATWIVAAGWAFHSVWDFAHHRANAIVPRAYAEWCAVLDAAVAVTILLTL